MADLPAAILFYAEVAIEGLIGDPEALAHRPQRITIDITDPNERGDMGFNGQHLPKRRITVTACDLATLGEVAPERWTCSAGYAHQRGAQACTATACYPDAR